MTTAFQAQEARSPRRFSAKALILSLAVAVDIVLWFFPSSIQPEARHALAVSSLVLIMWVAHFLPHAITGLIECYLFWTLVGVPFPTAFDGFSNSHAWFVMGNGGSKAP